MQCANDGVLSSLDGQTHHLLQTGSAFLWSPASSSMANVAHQSPGEPSNSGMLAPLGVPSFVSSFGALLSASAPTQSTVTTNSVSLPEVFHSSHNAPPLNQPFVVGHGYLPIPYKVVAQVIAGKYINMEDLLPENILVQEPEPQLLMDGHLVFSSIDKKPKQ